MKSMTGYGRCEKIEDGRKILAEIIQRRTEKISEVERLLNEKIEFEEE